MHLNLLQHPKFGTEGIHFKDNQSLIRIRLSILHTSDMFSSMFGHLYPQKKMFGQLFVGCSFLGFLEKFPLLQGAFAFKTLFLRNF